MVQPVLTKAVLCPAKAAATRMACHEYFPLSYPFLLVQNLQWIVPTDNMRPKSEFNAAKFRRCQIASLVVKG